MKGDGGVEVRKKGDKVASLEKNFDSKPWVFSTVIALLSVVTGTGGCFWVPLNVLSYYELSNRIAILGAVAGVAAILAGFASVVISYVMSADSKTMRRFRGNLSALGPRNWKSVMWSPFIASVCAIFGMIASNWFDGSISFGLLVWSLLEIVHGFVRTVHIQSSLFEVLKVEDAGEGQSQRKTVGGEYFDS